MSATATQLGALDDAMASLWKRYGEVGALVASSSFVISGTRASAELALQTHNKTLHFLDDTIPRVRAGSFSFDSWQSMANEAWRNMGSLVGFTGSWNFTGFGGAVASGVASNIAAGVDFAAGILPLVLIAAGLIALAVVSSNGRAIAATVRG